MNQDVARVLERIKRSLRYGGERVLHDLNTYTALYNISFSLSWSNPRYRSFVSIVKMDQILSTLQHFC